MADTAIVLERPIEQAPDGENARPCIHLRDRGEHDYQYYGVNGDQVECSYCGHPADADPRAG